MSLEEKIASSTYRYSVSITLMGGGEYGYTFRVIPFHPGLINKFDMGLIRWAVH